MSGRTLNVGVLGGGGFGRAIAAAAVRNGHEVLLWSRRAADMKGTTAVTHLAELAANDVTFFAVPSPYVEDLAKELGAHLDGRHQLVHVSRGLVGDDLEPISQVLRRVTPCRRMGALAGPLVAEALADGSPSGAILGSRFREVSDTVRLAIGSPKLRVYDSRDIVGVEFASAMVGLLALGVGYGQGVGAGPASLAVFLTRALHEAARLAPSLGADPATLQGLAGVGDLLAVVAGDDRPEILLGRAMAQGKTLADAASTAGTHIEGVQIARRLSAHARRLQLPAPITDTLVGVIEGMSAEKAMQALMARDVGTE